jgi:hypothetical protein
MLDHFVEVASQYARSFLNLVSGIVIERRAVKHFAQLVTDPETAYSDRGQFSP